MSYTTKRRFLNSSVYIVLGLVFVAILCVGIATFVGMRGKKPAKTPDEPTENSETRESPEPAVTPTPETRPTPSAPSLPSADVSADVTETPGGEPVIDPVKPVRYLPTEGTLLKNYSADLPVFSFTMNDYRTHAGIDISAPIGSPVCAMGDGTVLEIWSDPMMGMCLSIDHGDGLVSAYKNLGTIFPDGIVKGAKVTAGQTVASVGDTGLIELADAEHLHFELTENGKHVDPFDYLELGTLGTVDEGID